MPDTQFDATNQSLDVDPDQTASCAYAEPQLINSAKVDAPDKRRLAELTGAGESYLFVSIRLSFTNC
ncbi:hypothetical protein KYC_25987 [Achromobacter arsenitoxydans SY8]|uniref:Uncharacterized protein n=1 Tax=Achromobacter arsenitoxydans SY8 TaxID=477184 RepID=H0FEI3_9BURK|nr:hypothetical protein KYC_25987 [Achromobacter arsenitoxydans SY8]